MEDFWFAKTTPCTSGTKLFEVFDFQTYESYQQEFLALTPEKKGAYKGAEHYAFLKHGQQPVPLNFNFKKISDEINERLLHGHASEMLVIDTVFQSDLIMNLLISLENEDYIKEVYKQKKLRVKSGLNTSEATILMECFRQGRSLLQASQKADLLAKPLIDFYAASAYAYAIIVVNSPLHKSIDTLKGSHGHSYDHKDKTVNFGGNIPSGTFLDLMASISVAQIVNRNIRIDYSLLSSIDFIQNHSVKISLGALLSMIPELRDSYKRVDGTRTVTHKLSIDADIVNGQATYMFSIGDGINLPQKDNVEKCFKTTEVVEREGKYRVTITNSDLTQIMPTIYQDAKGQLWYIESPIDGLVIPEICLHFLTISALCNIMRYSPHDWSSIITNKLSSEYSLLISEYLRLFELKFPMLVTQLITNYIPILQ